MLLAMASNTASSIYCAVCKEKMNRYEKEPVCLPSCGHSFCRECLIGINDAVGRITCPTCRICHQGQLPQDLPVNWLLLEMLDKEMLQCAEVGCLAMLQQPFGHVECRTHSACAVQVLEETVWHHERCQVCYDLYAQITDDLAPKDVKDAALATLKVWVGGFGRNVGKTRPYILSRVVASVLYPNSKTSAVAEEVAAPYLQAIGEEFQGLEPVEGPEAEVVVEVGGLHLSSELMQTDQVVEAVVSPSPSFSSSDFPTFPSLTPSPVASRVPSRTPPGFEGFGNADANKAASVRSNVKAMKTKQLPAKVKSGISAPSAADTTSKNKSSRSSSKDKSSRRTKEKPATPSAAPSPASTLLAAAILSPAPTLTPTLPATSGLSSAEVPVNLEALASILVQKVSQEVASQVARDMAALSGRLESHMSRTDQSVSELSGIVSQHQLLMAQTGGNPLLLSILSNAANLPPFEAGNPWRLAFGAVLRDGKLTIEGCGTRPLEDFEFHPADLQSPFLGYARLTREALVREDKVPAETLIFPREAAQSAWLRFMKEMECVNTKITPFKGKYTTFTIPKDHPLPCTTKIAELTLKAAEEDKSLPQLKETDLTSLLVPEDPTYWHQTPETFQKGKLETDCASTQFNERLLKLPEHLIKAEFEARCRLSRSLHSITSAEMIASAYPTAPEFQVLTKSLLGTFQHDLFDFAVARRACRKFVLRPATIRHEPNKLIKSSIWGPSLFPEDLVAQVTQETVRVNQTLATRWALKFKRPADPSPASTQKAKRPKKFQQRRFQRSPAVNQPSTSIPPPQQSYVWVQAPAPQSN
ncbi:uncharacterized protein LOC135196208 isoform X2 [Macrobrachium nipponense]|uniref:uncharacterized protein LOC135196208 isoform X2 n=1 Tax=Macrobrachium nipponense TaxID=159736 RepID=UPI0030C7EC84